MESMVCYNEEHRTVDCFNQLYQDHSRAVYAYLLGRTHDVEVACDLLQEVFLRTWRHMDVARDLCQQQQPYWVFRIAKNLVNDYYRKEHGKKYVLAPLDDMTTPSWSASQWCDPVSRIETREFIRNLNLAIMDLPEKLRTPLILQVFHHMPSGAIGSVLGKPAGTVRYEISQARRRLKKALGAPYS